MSEDAKQQADIRDILDGVSRAAHLSILDFSRRPDSDKIGALQALVAALESGLDIVRKRYYIAVPEPEPFPGAVGLIVKYSLDCVDVARKTKLIPERKS